MNKYKTLILLIFVVFVAFLLNSTLTFIFVRKSLENQTEDFLQAHLDSVTSLIDLNREEALKKLYADIKVARFIFYNKYSLQERAEKLDLQVKNQITNQVENVSVNKWFLNGEQLQYNYEYVDTVKQMLGGTSTIFQKMDNGFVRISTNVLTNNSSRAVGTYIPNQSEVIKTIMTGQRYYGRAYVVNDWYLTAYEPIWIEGKIKGMLYVGVKEKEFQNLRKTLTSILIGKSGYITVLDQQGNTIIGLDHQAKDFKNQDIFKRIKAEQGGIFYYSADRVEKIAVVNYYQPFDWYVFITINRSELVAEFLSTLEIFAIFFSLILSVIIASIISKIMKTHESFIKTLIETIPLPVFYKNKNYVFQYCNHGFEQFLGKTKKEIIGKHIYNLTHPENASVLNNIEQCVITNKNIQTYEIDLFSHQQSTKYHVMISIANYPNPQKVKGIIGVITDITKLKEYQDYLQQVSLHDQLTNLYNRQILKTIEQKVFKQAIRDKSMVSVIMLDVDLFKKYNDTYGHQQGDVCLKKVASVLLNLITRPLDFAVRYGGEEFLIVLPQTSLEGALHIAHQIQKEVVAMKIEHCQSPFGFVTISQGVYSHIPSQEDQLTTFIEAADKMLYQCKNRGRNCIQSRS